MVNRKFNPTIFEEGLGVIAIVGLILSSPLLRQWYSKWGATGVEVKKRLPGDEQVPHPNLENTRAITINAPSDVVWHWLVQLGQGRGGFYSYERLENLVGCGMKNADKIIPEYQHLEIGDRIRFSQDDKGPSFVVTAVEPGRAIILGGDNPPTSWGFILEPVDNGSTRLIIRYRQNYKPTAGNIIGWRFILDPMQFVMERKMLQGIKLRAESLERDVLAGMAV